MGFAIENTMQTSTRCADVVWIVFSVANRLDDQGTDVETAGPNPALGGGAVPVMDFCFVFFHDDMHGLLV